MGDRVLVAGQRRGVIRFCGQTDFAPGQFVCSLTENHSENYRGFGVIDNNYFSFSFTRYMVWH